MNVPFHRPPPQMADAVEKAKEAWLLGHGSAGPEVSDFEAAFAEYKDVDPAKVVAFDSCTSAMTIAVQVLGLKKVRVPALGWNATINAVTLAGATPVIEDVDQHGLMNWTSNVSKEGAKADGAIYVQLYGMSKLTATGSPKVIIDAAQALELYRERDAWATCYSFHTLKSLPLGGGGAALFKRKADADKARALRYHGVPSGPGGAREQLHRLGRKATMPAPFAAMGSEFIQYLDEWLERRREVVLRYNEAFSDLKVLPRSGYWYEEKWSWTSDACHAYVMLPKEPEAFSLHLYGEGIGNSRYYVPITSQHAWRTTDAYKGAEAIGDRAVAIPLFGWMEDWEVDAVIEAVKAWGGWSK